MLRLTGSDRAVAEVAAIAEHVASLTAAAAALRLRPDQSAPGEWDAAHANVPLLDESNAGDARVVLAEIRDCFREKFGHDEIPAFWRALAHQPKLLAATWGKEQLIMASGAIDASIKTYAAIAVAIFRQSDYWIAHYSRVLKERDDMDDATLVELAGAVMHYVSFNTIAHGMRLDAPVAQIAASDVEEGGRLEHIVPGVRKRVRHKPADD